MSTKKKVEKEHVDKAQVDGKAAGAAAGGVTGALVGAAVGGPIGAGIGAVAGTAAGGFTGAAFDYNEAEPEFRRDWESRSDRDQRSWEDVSPTYRYGFESAARPEYQGRSYDEARTELRKGWTGKSKFEADEPLIRTAWETRAGRALDAGREAVVPVVEEEMKVGKRKVETGGVRVETRVTEKPVEEQVHLHEEKVKVERRPANRAATAADTAFKEGTLELHETAEEAVVAKRARVVEEVVIGKEVRDHTETVRDTVRRTDVDVKKTKGKAKTTGTGITWESHEPEFRKDFETRYGTSGYSYDQFIPAYRFGHNLGSHEQYHGDWKTVEPEARRMWEEKNKGTWEEFKDAVRHSWEKVTGQT